MILEQVAPIKLALVDDHKLFRKGLVSLIGMALHRPSTILFEADNGLELQQKIRKDNLPDIILMDVNMPQMDGFESVKWLRIHYHMVKVLVVSAVEKEETIVKMLKLGVKGYLGKDVEPDVLREAVDAVYNKGFYYTDLITGKLLHSILSGDREKELAEAIVNSLTEREREFLKLSCSELTYGEIAKKMFISPKTVDGYRHTLFNKLAVKSRVGLALFAIRNGLMVL